MEEITVLLADDHVLLRQGTRELLEREEDLKVIGEAGDGEEAARLALQDIAAAARAYQLAKEKGASSEVGF